MIAKEFHLGTDFPKIDHTMWRKQVEVELKGADFDKRMRSRSYEGIELQALYTEEVFPTGSDPGGLPGYVPFVRGAQPLGNMLAGWDVRQEHAHPDPAVANAHILEDLNGGVTSIDLRLDGAAMHGLDADNAHAAHLTGHDGVSVSCVADLERLTRGVKLDIAGFHFDPGATPLVETALATPPMVSEGMPRSPAERVMAMLRGNWSIDRTVDPGGHFVGTACCTEMPDQRLMQAETGTLHLPDGTALEGGNRYIYTLRDDTIDVRFADGANAGAHFVDLAFSPAQDGVWPLQSGGRHQCRLDQYDAILRLETPDRYVMTYVVCGPRKGYVSRSVYTRVM